MSEYILFIHGVATRFTREQPNYANKLIEEITKVIGNSNNLKTISLYWGDVDKKPENQLLAKLEDNQSCWQQLWFKKLRATTLLQFVGDAVAYISRKIGSEVVETLNQQMIESGLDRANAGERLHLVTHSWGTVILFDILFAARWTDEKIPGYESAMAIRKRFYGIEPCPEEGISLASIHTMGSPIALFSLLDAVQGEEQAKGESELTQNQARQSANLDITPKLQYLLDNLSKNLNGNKLPWRNYIHPGDPVAWPLNPLIYSLIDGLTKIVDMQDVLTRINFLESLMLPFSQTPLALMLDADTAHSKYWNSTQVAREIAKTIQQVS
ncbi:hypothetical protein NIES2101_42305 [Calothrix sp. HK-06]|nr:hypothetical protein NIES2101_42305 [Calothrix sp. HK-06]